jgi:hypothetical protein
VCSGRKQGGEGRPTQSFVSVHYFHKAMNEKLKVSFNSIIMETVTISSHKAKNPLTANDNHTTATVIITHIIIIT